MPRRRQAGHTCTSETEPLADIHHDTCNQLLGGVDRIDNLVTKAPARHGILRPDRLEDGVHGLVFTCRDRKSTTGIGLTLYRRYVVCFVIFGTVEASLLSRLQPYELLHCLLTQH
jgi:hypothetical protein